MRRRPGGPLGYPLHADLADLILLESDVVRQLFQHPPLRGQERAQLALEPVIQGRGRDGPAVDGLLVARQREPEGGAKRAQPADEVICPVRGLDVRKQVLLRACGVAALAADELDIGLRAVLGPQVCEDVLLAKGEKGAVGST